MHLNKLIEIGKLEFKTSIIYRTQFMSSIIISPMLLLISYFIWEAVYKNTKESTILGYTFNDMITYYVLTMIIGHFIFNMVGNRLQEKITYGELTQDLLKPVPVFLQFLSREIANRSFAFIVEVIPVFVISFLLFNLKIASISALLFFSAGLILAFFLNFLISFLMGLLAFWVNKIEAVQWLMFVFVRFLSGEFIPLEFMGQLFFMISKFLPFFYLRYGIIQLFIGKLSFKESMAIILMQLAWIILLFIAIKIVWHYALKKFGAQGG